ncbi:MAG: hypothetical protein LBB22_04095 [Treponema sp.]|nr:hypothetical protein [Treponema sp.]
MAYATDSARQQAKVRYAAAYPKRTLRRAAAGSEGFVWHTQLIAPANGLKPATRQHTQNGLYAAPQGAKASLGIRN